jgi:predicted nucleic-acid-binding Zn-ribbon protein
MREIICVCPKCQNKNIYSELTTWSWSAFDLGVLVCNVCGYTIDYNKERDNEMANNASDRNCFE